MKLKNLPYFILFAFCLGSSVALSSILVIYDGDYTEGVLHINYKICEESAPPNDWKIDGCSVVKSSFITKNYPLEIELKPHQQLHVMSAALTDRANKVTVANNNYSFKDPDSDYLLSGCQSFGEKEVLVFSNKVGTKRLLCSHAVG